jgi:hypothetical protein
MAAALPLGHKEDAEKTETQNPNLLTPAAPWLSLSYRVKGPRQQSSISPASMHLIVDAKRDNPSSIHLGPEIQPVIRSKP